MKGSLKPARPVAVLWAAVGVGMLVLALTSFPRITAGLVLWICLLLAIVGFNLWSAVAPGEHARGLPLSEKRSARDRLV